MVNVDILHQCDDGMIDIERLGDSAVELLREVGRSLISVNFTWKEVYMLTTTNLRTPFCRTVVVLGASALEAQEDRTRVAPNLHMGVPTGAPTEGRQKAALPPPPEAHPALGPQ